MARVLKIERRADSAFARIVCEPVAKMASSLHVLVLHPLSGQILARPVEKSVPTPDAKKGKP